jgi:hypothetical protein
MSCVTKKKITAVKLVVICAVAAGIGAATVGIATAAMN